MNLYSRGMRYMDLHNTLWVVQPCCPHGENLRTNHCPVSEAGGLSSHPLPWRPTGFLESHRSSVHIGSLKKLLTSVAGCSSSSRINKRVDELASETRRQWSKNLFFGTSFIWLLEGATHIQGGSSTSLNRIMKICHRYVQQLVVLSS